MELRRIVKRGPVVLATREDGSMDPSSATSQGLFLADTRYLSEFRILINGQEPVLMGSSEETLFQASFIFTNPALEGIPARGLGLLQRNTLEESDIKIALRVANWSLASAEFEISIKACSDFFDSFEARGVKRLQRGELCEPKLEHNTLELKYEGLDKITRTTCITADPTFNRFDDGTLYFRMQLDNGEQKEIDLSISLKEENSPTQSQATRPEVARAPKPPWFDDHTVITTGNQDVDAIIRRSTDDLQLLMTEFEDAWVPAAGLPRFAVPFGRDSLLTGLYSLVWNPTLSRDILRFLAHRQGKEENPWNYEQPGKILHELHTGELARLREIPFGQFYGSVDSTVLFLVLAAEYIRWTGDLALFRELKPNFDAAWKWIDEYGDIDGSGYVQYKAHTPPKLSTAALTVGLFNQGWKDSANAVMYRDGKMVADHPISLAEVQADLYRALELWAQLYKGMPEAERMSEEADRLEARAAKLSEQFNREFWMEDRQYYAMALDGNHKQVDTVTSNPAWGFWARIIDERRARPTAKTLMAQGMFTSWGIRTMANEERAYNPFSYHNGSIWPFENALIASGLKKYGLVQETQDVFDALVRSAGTFEYHRWPEVYAGVSEDVGGVIARQPDACSPQAWSASSIFLLMQTILGIATRPCATIVDITPVLPSCLEQATFDNIAIGGGKLSFRLVREGGTALMDVRHNPDDLDIVVHPATRLPDEIDKEGGPAVTH